MSNPAPSLDTGARLAIDRTWLAHERTMLAWVRTAVSLISFGFTIDKFFQLQFDERPAGGPEPLIGARGYAMILSSMGLGSLILAWVEHRRGIQALRAQFGDIEPTSVAAVVAGVIGGLGVLTILLVVFRQ